MLSSKPKRVAQLERALDQVLAAQEELRLIKSVRNTKHAMNLVTRIGRVARAGLMPMPDEPEES